MTVYESLESVVKLTAVINDFADIWEDKGDSVELSEQNWMRIPLRADWEFKITGKSKVYSLGIKDRVTVDEVFDKL